VRAKFLIVCVVAAGGCDGALTSKPTNGTTDAGLLNNVTPPSCPDPGLDVTPTPTYPAKHPAPGTECLSCHSQGGTASPFTMAGTLYTRVDTKTPLAGAVIHVKSSDDLGVDVTAISAADGNFWTTANLSVPAVAFVTGCPIVHGMNQTIDSAGGSCNKSGCHSAGAGVYLNFH
jgi:hypothetical protein